MKKVKILLLSCLYLINSVYAQDNGCNVTFSGRIIDQESKTVVAHAHLKVSNQATVLSNHSGQFKINNLCKGANVNINISHIAYEDLALSFTVQKDTVLDLLLNRKTRKVEEVTVESTKTVPTSQSVNRISKQQRAESQGKNLAEILTDVSGVNILRTGANIAKPVVNGLFGNRLILLNNGVRHESQQWGTDHAPEIDPFSGQNISVIKNADAVRYGADALAGIIKIEPSLIANDRRALSNTSLVWNSNGRGAILNTQLEGTIQNFAYRIGATGKKAGNLKTADYYLGNTGNEELNFNINTQYTFKRSKLEFYGSHFGNTLAVFEGAHIGSKEDILARIAHGRPFDEYDFNYAISAPKQNVTHQLAKLKYSVEIDDDSRFETQYSFQRNHRKEFDLRRVLEDDVPMADIVLTTQQLEAIYSKNNSTIGVSGSLQVNNNTAGTGTTPIIPNFDNHTVGVFASQKIPFGKNLLEAGLRYDYKYFDVAGYRYDYNNPAADGSIEQYLLTDQKHFNNLSGILGVNIPLAPSLQWRSNIGLAWRAPSANELYSDGIHHGTGTYEVGNANLKSEKGWKWVNSLSFEKNIMKANIDFYGQIIQDYIYSQPNPDSVRQTIRGAFPLFQYEQTDALFYGTDISLAIDVLKELEYQTNFSFVRAKNRTNDSYLPYIPSDRLQNAITYILPTNKLGKTYFKLKHTYQAEQARYEVNSDFAAPPAAYHLFDIIGATSFTSKQNRTTNIQIQVENLFNTTYKDYMDRFRYYAHGLGRNVSIKLNYTF